MRNNACKTCGATNYGGRDDLYEDTHGGGFVDELGKLAIPLGLIAAKEGVASYYNSKKAPAKAPAKKAPAAKKASPAPKAKKAQAVRRRGAAAFGGSSDHDPLHESFFGGWDAEEMSPMVVKGGSHSKNHGLQGQWGGYEEDKKMYHGGGGDDSTMACTQINNAIELRCSKSSTSDKSNANEQGGNVVGNAMTGAQAPPQQAPPTLPQAGGAAQQHALIAQEFRRMAAEIGSFLDKKAKNVPAPKKPADGKKKKTAADPKKTPAKKAAADPKKKKKKVAADPKKKKDAFAGFW